MPGIAVDLTIDVKSVERMLFGVEKKAVPKAAGQALNRVIGTVRTRSVRQVSKETGLKQAAMRRHMRLIKSRRGRMSATLIAESYAPNLTNFSARPTKAGVRARVYQQSVEHKGAFMAARGRPVFKRVGDKRLPIKGLRGPSLRRSYLQGHIRKAMRGTGAERWSIEMDRSLKRQIALVNRRR